MSYSITRDQIIKTALRRTGKHDHSDAVPPHELQDAVNALDLMLQEWVIDVDLPLRETITLFLNKDQKSYTEGTDAFATDPIKYTASIAGDVATITGAHTITTSHSIALPGTDQTLQTFTVTAVNGQDITLSATPDTGYKSYLYAYTSAELSFRNVIHATRRTDDVDIPLEITSWTEYGELATKDSEGPPTQVHNNKKDPNTIYVWPVRDSETDYIELRVQLRQSEMTTSTTTTGYPPEWQNTICWNLAAELGPEYEVNEYRQRRLDAKAADSYARLLSADVSEDSLYIEPEYDAVR